MSKQAIDNSAPFTGVYIIGACSCWYHGVGFWVGLFCPWYIGAAFVGVVIK